MINKWPIEINFEPHKTLDLPYFLLGTLREEYVIVIMFMFGISAGFRNMTIGFTRFNS